MKTYQAYLLDLDGTVYRGDQVIKEAPSFIQWLVAHNIPYLFLTNNSALPPEKVAAKLQAMNIPCSPEHVYTTSMATAEYIDRLGDGRRVYAIGEEGLITALIEAECTLTEERPDYVVVGIDRNFTYEKMMKASLAIQQGARFLSTNPDRAVPTERGFVPGNGALTTAIAVASGCEPTYIGKPEALFVELALERLGVSRQQVLLVGDNRHTDIAAGVAANIDTLLVYTGITQPDDLASAGCQPTYTAEHLQEWVNHFVLR